MSLTSDTATFKSHLLEQYARGLPGRESLFKMAALPKKIIDVPVPIEAKQSAVIELIYPREGELHICFIRRVHNEKDRHSGQISFPGGRKDDTDLDLEYTAMRECYEEVGVSLDHDQLIGPMTPFYIPVSGYFVQPYLSILDYSPEFIAQDSEVAHILEIPIRHLIQEKIRGTTTRTVSGGKATITVPYFDLKGEVLWGATAMFTAELIDLITVS